MTLKLAVIVFGICSLVFVSGCSEPMANKTLLSVDFNQNQTLRYKFVTERNIDIHWNQSDDSSKSHKRSKESVNMIMKYEPVEVDAYGITKIKAYCDSIKVEKSGSSKDDAARSLKGKSFVITVGPNGKVHDKSDLKRVIREAGKKAFRKGSDIKDPDLIEDFMATQWFLWDSVSSIDNPVEGIKVGQQWKSKLLVPNSMAMRLARDVTYELEEIRETDRGKIAVIKSTYALTDSVPSEWPLPWAGRFQLAGQFGFFRSMFRGLSVIELSGQGKELFNIDTGQTESYEQTYRFKMKPKVLPLPETDPLITIDQRLSMQLLE
ncbi:MAG: hypothetical protein PVG93_04800 [Phycisphaerales bacterium]|jgi:hypothetical protein